MSTFVQFASFLFGQFASSCPRSGSGLFRRLGSAFKLYRIRKHVLLPAPVRFHSDSWSFRPCRVSRFS